MKFHGKYCGPYWSDNKRQLSVAYGSAAVDALDQLCKEHDAAYATSIEPKQFRDADLLFAHRALELGWPKSLVAGIAVGAQGALRAGDIIIKNMTKKTVQSLRKMYKPTPKPSAPKSTQQAAGTCTAQPPTTTMGYMPAAYITTSRTKQPKSKAGKDGGVTLSHRGLISSFVGSATYVANNFQTNPGLGSVFPWCSQLARSYDKYRFKKLRFEYRAVVPTTTAGVVMMSFDYDTLDSLPPTKFEHAQTTPNVESNAYNSFTLDVKCDDAWRFVRQGAIAGGDLKTYDFGQMVISCSYGTATLIGEIYVDYEVELAKPSHGVPITQRLVSTGVVGTPFTTVVSTLGTAQAVVVASDTSLRFVRPGEYQVSCYVTGAGMGVVNAPVFVAPIVAGTVLSGSLSAIVNGAATVCTVTYRVRVGTGDVLFWAGCFGGGTGYNILITESEYSAF